MLAYHQMAMIRSTILESIPFHRFNSIELPSMNTEFYMAEQSILLNKITTCVLDLCDRYSQWTKSPTALFNVLLATILSFVFIMKCIDHHAQRQKSKSPNDDEEDDEEDEEESGCKPECVKSLQLRFLPVFWLLRMAFWMSGPYFYAVYAAKSTNGTPITMATISHIFLTGFASIALVGPMTGRLLDQYGRKKGTVAAAIIYSLGALSTKSSVLSILFVGRAIGGLGTSLMGSAPEAWLVSEFQKLGGDVNRQWISETFGWAYSMDSIIAIAAGQIASLSASRYGPSGPFQISPVVLAAAAVITALFWKENAAQNGNTIAVRARRSSKIKVYVPSISDALDVIVGDEKLIMVGAIQSLFESSMYIFVMIWPRAMNEAVQNVYGDNAGTPYGTVFSCFMACCMVGSYMFGKLGKRSIPVETSSIGLLAVACLSLIGATYFVNEIMSMTGLIVTFFVFEACVGMYFPSIGTLRSMFLPNAQRSLIMTLYGVPLNILVVSVFLSIHKIGTVGAFSIAALELCVATLCMIRLRYLHKHELKQSAQRRWGCVKAIMKVSMVVVRSSETLGWESEAACSRRRASWAGYPW